MVEYLTAKAGPPMVEIKQYEELAPFIDSLNEDMDNDFSFSGILAIVLGIFPTSDQV